MATAPTEHIEAMHSDCRSLHHSRALIGFRNGVIGGAVLWMLSIATFVAVI